MTKDEVVASILFSRDAGTYDNLRRRLVPCFDDFYGTALKLIQEWQTTPEIHVLDIGAGTGLFSAMVLAQSPAARLCLLDGSFAMLDQARNRFSGIDQVEYHVAHMANVDLTGADLGGNWDLIISALAIHHLTDDHKRDLYRRIHGALKPGGLFVNAEQVAGPTAISDARYSKIWHEQIRQLGASEEEIETALERMSHDKCAALDDQLQWLTQVGFSNVDCSFKAWRFAVFSGQAPN